MVSRKPGLLAESPSCRGTRSQGIGCPAAGAPATTGSSGAHDPLNCTPIPNAVTEHRNFNIPWFLRRLALFQRNRKAILALAIPILKRLEDSQRCRAFSSSQRMPRIRMPSHSQARSVPSVTTGPAPSKPCANVSQIHPPIAVSYATDSCAPLAVVPGVLHHRNSNETVRSVRFVSTPPIPCSKAAGFVSQICSRVVPALQPVPGFRLLHPRKSVKPVRSVRFAAAGVSRSESSRWKRGR